MSDAELAPFHTLIKLVERELELAGQGRLTELQDAIAATGAHLASLPQPIRESARPLLLRADAVRGRVTIETERMQERIMIALTALRQERRLTRSYAPPPREQISTTV